MGYSSAEKNIELPVDIVGKAPDVYLTIHVFVGQV